MVRSLTVFRSALVFVRPNLAKITPWADWEQPDFTGTADSWAENPTGTRYKKQKDRKYKQ